MSDNNSIQSVMSTIQQGLAALFGGVSHQPVKKIIVKDPLMVNIKTLLGGSLFAKADTEIIIEMNDAAQNLSAEAEKEAARIEADGQAEASRIEAQGHADAHRAAAEHGHAPKDE